MESVSELPLVGTYLETDFTTMTNSSGVTEVDNYNKLGYGFCVFCDPG